jgi:hypothetical protein
MDNSSEVVEPKGTISWEFKPPWNLNGDEDIFYEINKWLSETLSPRLESLGGVYVFKKRTLHLSSCWKLLIGKDADLDLARRRSTGLIHPEDGPMPVFFFLALKGWFEDEQMKNGLNLSYDDATSIGTDIKNEDKLLEFFDISSFEEVRSAAEAFGLIPERIKFVGTKSNDWF